MDRLQAMRIFSRVAELESFTAAADALDLPKATVTVAVQELEASVGVRLLDRTTRRVSLTQDGSSYFERCLDLLNEFDEAESMFRVSPAQITGKIRVDMGTTIARDYVIPMIPRFLETFPGIEIELSSSDRRVDVIREGFDCVIRGGNLKEAGLGERVLGATAFINVASREYLEKHGRPRSVEDLRDHWIVGYTQMMGTAGNTFEYFDGEKFRELRMRSKITVNSTDAYAAACLAGLGLIQVPRYGVEKFLASGQMVEVLPKFTAEPMQVKIVYALRRHMPQRVRVFLDFLEETAGSYEHMSAVKRKKAR